MDDLSLESALKQLPEPSPPAGLAATVLLRAARIDEEREAARRRAGSTSRSAPIDRVSWTTVLMGLAVTLSVQVFALVSGQPTVPLVPSPFRVALAGRWDASLETLVAAAGVGLCLAGLFRSIEPRHDDAAQKAGGT
jgi:hypothetical protein